MADSYGVLSQFETATTTAETVYEVPSATEAIIKSIIVADTGGTGETIRLSIFNSATLTTVVFLPDTTFSPGGHGEYTGAVTLRAGDRIRSYASGLVGIHILGVEREA